VAQQLLSALVQMLSHECTPLQTGREQKHSRLIQLDKLVIIRDQLCCDYNLLCNLTFVDKVGVT
jgi:hypothetical protein